MSLTARERAVFEIAQKKAAEGSARILSGEERQPNRQRRAAALEWRMFVWQVIDRSYSK